MASLLLAITHPAAALTLAAVCLMAAVMLRCWSQIGDLRRGRG